MAQLLLTPRILWAALLCSQAIYVALLVVPGLLERPPAGEVDPTLPLVLGAAALAIAVASFLVPATLRRAALAQLDVPIVEEPDPDEPIGFRGSGKKIRRYADPQAALRRAMQLGFVPFILSLALSEAVTIQGFVLGFLGHPALVWAPFAALGAALTAIRFPTARSFVGPFEQATGARFAPSPKASA